MEMLDFLERQSASARSQFETRGESRMMNRELSKAAEGTAHKIRASFGLVDQEHAASKAKARLKKRRKKKVG